MTSDDFNFKHCPQQKEVAELDLYRNLECGNIKSTILSLFIMRKLPTI